VKIENTGKKRRINERGRDERIGKKMKKRKGIGEDTKAEKQ